MSTWMANAPISSGLEGWEIQGASLAHFRVSFGLQQSTWSFLGTKGYHHSGEFSTITLMSVFKNQPKLNIDKWLFPQSFNLKLPSENWDCRFHKVQCQSNRALPKLKLKTNISVLNKLSTPIPCHNKSKRAKMRILHQSGGRDLLKSRILHQATTWTGSTLTLLP